MSTAKRPPLAGLLYELRSAAERHGDDRSLTLSGGARVAWRIKDGRMTFAVSRKEKRVGDTELITFQAAAGVPASAKRIPTDGQTPLRVDGETWFRVCWQWNT